MAKRVITYLILFSLSLPACFAYCTEVKINRKSGYINYELIKEYNYDDVIRKYAFDDDMKITDAVTRYSAFFYDKNEHIKHEEPINGYYGNIFYSGNKEFHAVINYVKATKVTNITLFNNKFERVWHNSFNLLGTKRVYISDDGKSVIHYGIGRARGFASITFIGEDGEIIKKDAGFQYVKDSYAYSPVKRRFLAQGRVAYDFNGDKVWTIDEKYKEYKDRSGICNYSMDGERLVGIYESQTQNEGDLLFIDNSGAIYKTHHVNDYFDSIITFSQDNKYCIVFASESLMMFQLDTGVMKWEYDLSSYKTEDDVELVAYSVDSTFGAERIAVAVVPRRMGLYLSATYLIIFNSDGTIVSESVIDDVSKISNLPPVVRISKDGKSLTLKFDRSILKYSLSP